MLQTPTTSMQFDTIVYHHPCSDGTCAAWILSKWKAGDGHLLVKAKHGMKLEESAYKDRNVVIVDFSFSKDYLLEIAEKSKHTLLLDHHLSAQTELNGVSHPRLEIVFDMKKCGSRLAWEYVFPDGGTHWIVDLIEDRDLWRWADPKSKAIGRATYDLGYHNSIQTFDDLYNSTYSKDYFYEIGVRILDEEKRMIDNHVKNVYMCDFVLDSLTYKVAMSSAPSHIRSEVGSKIMETYSDVDIAVMYTYSFPQDEWWLSFRTNKSSVDLSVITKKMPNGGGHAKAAGATIYGPASKPPTEFESRKGETMATYFKARQ